MDSLTSIGQELLDAEQGSGARRQMVVLLPPTPVESLPDEVIVAGVPGGLLNQVQQHPAQVAVDDVRPCAGVVEFHGVHDLPGRLCCLLVASRPLLDRVPVVDEEVLVWDRGLMLRPPIREGAPSDNALEPAGLPNCRVLEQAEQGERAGRRCPTRVGITDPPDLPDQRIPLLVEETGEGIPLVRGG